MARPSEYDYTLCIEICDKIAEGAHVIKVLESDERFPAWSTFRRWKRDSDQLQTLYAHSIQDKAEMVTFEINQTMQDMRDGSVEPSVGRIIIDTLKWYASKFYPKMYGDKLDLTSDGDKLNTTLIQITPELIKEIAEKL